MQKSLLSQQKGKCRVSAEKGIASPDLLCHRLGVLAQPQPGRGRALRQIELRGRKRRKHRKRTFKDNFNLLDYLQGVGIKI